ncbi:hypothetical protein KKP62_10380 [Rhodococcus sp. GOMB7]|uniref:hypothetical protein n=1 Tax=Rhodococcus sp. GOMB7 TaxID=2839033 RepID=UPI001C006E89|nr:hypothetical protein [Rhodococcus sp. GOMB7]MBT9295369.1 hypothetical protein [Rhodococcus sp. GOMB7]
MSDYPTLRVIAEALDAKAIKLTQKGKRKKALTAVKLAVALENRQQQIEATDFNPLDVVNPR